MTPTASELLNDRAFLERRIREQVEYMDDYTLNFLSMETDLGFLITNGVSVERQKRYREVMSSANGLLEFYRTQKEKLER